MPFHRIVVFVGAVLVMFVLSVLSSARRIERVSAVPAPPPKAAKIPAPRRKPRPRLEGMKESVARKIVIAGNVKPDAHIRKWSSLISDEAIDAVHERANVGSASKMSDTAHALRTPSKVVEQKSGEYIARFLQYDSNLCKQAHVLKGENQKEPDVRICLDNVSPPCNVLSFGIAYNWIFDDYMLARGCRVWSFDPSMRSGDYKRHPNHEFFPVGVGSVDGKHTGKSTLYGGKHNYAVKTLRAIIDEMNVPFVDVVRMDVESAEWDVLRDWSHGEFDQIGQLLLEIHMNGDLSDHAEVLKGVPMSVFWSARNGWNGHRIYKHITQVYEVGLLRAPVRSVGLPFARPARAVRGQLGRRL